jgi:hypothetical protein
MDSISICPCFGVVIRISYSVLAAEDNTILVSFIDVGQRLEYMLSNYFQSLIDKQRDQ